MAALGQSHCQSWVGVSVCLVLGGVALVAVLVYDIGLGVHKKGTLLWPQAQ